MFLQSTARFSPYSCSYFLPRFSSTLSLFSYFSFVFPPRLFSRFYFFCPSYLSTFSYTFVFLLHFPFFLLSSSFIPPAFSSAFANFAGNLHVSLSLVVTTRKMRVFSLSQRYNLGPRPSRMWRRVTG